MSFNVSYYKIGLISSTASGSGDHDSGDHDSGDSDRHHDEADHDAGHRSSGQVLVLHTSLGQLASMIAGPTPSNHLSTCTLVTAAGAGSSISYAFRLVNIRSVTAIGGDPLMQDTNNATYLKVLLEFSDLNVTIGPTLR